MALIAHWPLNGTLKDISGNGHDLILETGTEKYNSNRSHMIFDGNTSLKMKESVMPFIPRTFSCWYYYDKSVITSTNKGGYGFILAETVQRENIEIHINSVDDLIRFIYIRDGNGAVVPRKILDSNIKMNPNAWNHIAFRLFPDTGNERVDLWINGEYAVDANKLFDTHDTSQGYSAWRNSVKLGKRDNTQSDWFLVGGLKDVRIYSHPLSDTEVRRLMPTISTTVWENSDILHLPLDRSLTSIQGKDKYIINESIKYDYDDFIGHCITVSKVNKGTIVDMYNFLREKEFTLSCWVKVNAQNPDPASLDRINVFTVGLPDTGAFHFLFQSGARRFQVACWNSENCNGPVISDENGVYTYINDIDTSWHHYSLTVNNVDKTFTVDIDGVRHSLSSFTNSLWAQSSDGLSITFGGEYAMTGNGFGDVSIKDFRITTYKPDFNSIKNFYKIKRDRREMIAHWPLVNNFEDTVGKLELTYPVNMATITKFRDGKIGAGMYGPVGRDVVVKNTPYLLGLMERSFSVSFWYKEFKAPINENPYQIFGTWSDYSNEQKGICISVRLSGSPGNIDRPMAIYFYGDKRKHDIYMPESINHTVRSSWNHYSFTYNGILLRIYFNGKKVLEYNIYANGTTRMSMLGTANTDNLRSLIHIMGSSEQSKEHPESFSVQDLRIHNYALDEDEIDEIMECEILDFKADKYSQPMEDIYGLNMECDKDIKDQSMIDKGYPNAVLPPAGWSPGYNGGVTNPTVGTHAHWIGLDDERVMVFDDRNSSVGLPHRWLGIHAFSIKGYLASNRTITVSWEQMVKEGPLSGIRCNIWHKKTTSPDYGFFDTVCDRTNTVVGKWERFEAVMPIGDNYDYTCDSALYFYGNVVGSGESLKYVRRVRVEVGNFATPYGAPTCINMYTRGANMLNKLPSTYARDGSGFNPAADDRNMVYPRPNGNLYVENNLGNTRLSTIIDKLKVNRRYTVSMEFKSDTRWVSGYSENEDIENTITYQVQYNSGSLGTNETLWPRLETTGGQVKNYNTGILERLDDGWYRYSFQFTYLPINLTSTTDYSTLFLQAGRDYTGYKRKYQLRNISLNEGSTPFFRSRPAIIDRSKFGNHGFYWNLLPHKYICGNNSVEFVNNNGANLYKLAFDNIGVTSNFTWAVRVKFLETKTSGNEHWGFIGYGVGSQCDALSLNADGTIVYRYYHSKTSNNVPTLDTYLDTGVRITDKSKWYDIVVTYDGENFKTFLDGELKSNKTVKLYSVQEGINSVYGTFGTANCGFSGNHHQRCFEGEIRNIKIFASALEDSKIKNIFEEKVILKEDGTMILPRSMSKKYTDFRETKVLSIGFLTGYNSSLFRSSYDTRTKTFLVGVQKALTDGFQATESRNISWRYFLGRGTLEKIRDRGCNDVWIIYRVHPDMEPMTSSATDLNDYTEGLVTYTNKNTGLVATKITLGERLDDTYQFIDARFRQNSNTTFTASEFRVLGDDEFRTGLLNSYEVIPYRNTNLIYGGSLKPYDVAHGAHLRSQKLSYFTIDDPIQYNFKNRDRDITNGSLENVICAVSHTKGGYNGGFDTQLGHLPVVSSQMYRFSVWIKRDNAFYKYLGEQMTHVGGGSIFETSADSSDNVYMSAPEGSKWEAKGLPHDWVLFVCFVLKRNDGWDSRPDTGYFMVDSNKKLHPLSFTDAEDPASIGTSHNIKFKPNISGIVQAMFRSYMYYATRENEYTYWCSPRLDCMDGTEPSVAELLLHQEKETDLSRAERNFYNGENTPRFEDDFKYFETVRVETKK